MQVHRVHNAQDIGWYLRGGTVERGAIRTISTRLRTGRRISLPGNARLPRRKRSVGYDPMITAQVGVVPERGTERGKTEDRD